MLWYFKCVVILLVPSNVNFIKIQHDSLLFFQFFLTTNNTYCCLRSEIPHYQLIPAVIKSIE